MDRISRLLTVPIRVLTCGKRRREVVCGTGNTNFAEKRLSRAGLRIYCGVFPHSCDEESSSCVRAVSFFGFNEKGCADGKR